MNASELEPLESTFIGPEEDELTFSKAEFPVVEDLLILLSSFVAIASHIKGDNNEKFASNSFIDPSYKVKIFIGHILILSEKEIIMQIFKLYNYYYDNWFAMREMMQIKCGSANE